MIKAVIKEIIIFLLLLFSIALILGILFYDYMPINRTVPSKVVPYNIPADLQNELNTALQQSQNVIKTYSIDTAALTTYNKGKINPFAAYTPPANTTDNNTAGSSNGTNTNTNTNSSAAANNSSNTNSEGTFYEIPPSAPKNTGK